MTNNAYYGVFIGLHEVLITPLTCYLYYWFKFVSKPPWLIFVRFDLCEIYLKPNEKR